MLLDFHFINFSLNFLTRRNVFFINLADAHPGFKIREEKHSLEHHFSLCSSVKENYPSRMRAEGKRLSSNIGQIKK